MIEKQTVIKHSVVRVFGGVALSRGGEPVELGGGRQRRLLAALVATRGATLSADQLIDRVWSDGALPDDPRRSLYTYLTRLRQAFGDEPVLMTEPGGWRLDPSKVEVDRDQFESLVSRARQAGIGAHERLALLDDALRIANGRPFGDLDSLEWVRPEAERLEELRITAIERRYDAMLDAGKHTDAVPGLAAEVDQHPLRERLVGLQMLALHRSGRQAEAARAFQAHRERQAEMGLEPGAELVELERRILAADPELAAAPTGQALRGYRLGEQLGEGAFAVVYRGTQPSVGRDVAVKIIRSELANRPEFIRRFEAEAHLVARLEHPHIVPLYDYWREPDRACLVFRYLRGGSLESRLTSTGPLSIDEAVTMVEQVGLGLSVAHSAGVVHRDVKPANVFTDDVGNFYLGDFGIALEAADAAGPGIGAGAALSAGSPAYASPEQLKRQAVGPAADIHGFGISVYEALTARLPFPDAVNQADLLQRQMHDPIPPVRAQRTDVPNAVDVVLAKATAKNPADRYQDVLDFVRDFVAAAKPGAAAPKRGGATVVSIGEERNPYKGLRAFSEADAGDFHGRERLVGRLVELFARNDTAGRIAAVVGPSGIGKSSVVRAGLLPALRRGAVPGSDQWFVATMLPGTDPFEELGAALLRVATSVPENMMGLLAADHRGITRVVKALVPEDSGAQILLVLDQFEELFTLVEDEQLRRRFLDGLEHALTDARCPLRVVLTIRADFWDRPLRHGTFARLIEHSTANVTALAPDEIERAIVDPAESVGCRFEPGLVSEIVADVTDEPGALPLLQYALTELWERRVSGVLTRAAYREIGGVSGALARRAEELFLESGLDEQAEIRRIFGRLVTLGEGVEDTRRRVLRSELGESSSVDGVLDGFGRARLLSFDRDLVSREPSVEVAHEALIREWPRLRVWLEEDRDGLRVLRHVTESAASWVAGGRPESELYRGGRLEAAEGFASSHVAELTPVEAEFVAASVEAREREVAAEQDRFEQQARSNRRLRRLLAGVGVALVVAMLAGLLAFQQRSQARESAAAAEASSAEAKRSAEAAETRRLIASSSSVVDENPEIGLLLASEAYRREPGPASLAGLQRVLTSTDSYLGWLGAGTQYFGVSWVGDRVIGVSADSVDVFDPVSRERVQSIPFGDDPDPDDPPHAQWLTARPPVAISGDGNVVGVARSSRGVVLVNIIEEEVAELVHTSTVTALALDVTGARLAVGDLDRDIAVHASDGGSPLLIEAFRERKFTELPYADGYELPSAMIQLWDNQIASIFFGNGVLDLAFLDDGSLASASSGMVKVFGADGVATRSIAPTSVHPTFGRIPAPPHRVHTVNGLLRSSGGTGVTFHRAADEPDETLRLFTGREDANTLAVDSRSLSADLIVSVLNSGRLTVTPRDSAQVGRVLESNPVPGPSDLALSPDGGVAAVANSKGISLTALDGRQLLARAVPNQGRQLPAISFDGEQLTLSSLVRLSASALWVDLTEGTTVEVAPDPDGNVVHNIWWMSPDVLASGPDPGWAFLGEEMAPVRLPREAFGEALSPDERLIVVGRAAGTDGNDSPELIFLSLPDGDVIDSLDLGPWIGKATIRRSVFSPDGKRLVTAFSDGRAVVIDPQTREVVYDKLGPDANGRGGITAINFSLDGGLLVTGDASGSIDLRDPETYKIVDSLVGGVTNTENLSYGPYISADSRYLLTTREQRPRLWDIEARMAIGTFPSEEGHVPDATAGEDHLNLVTTLGEYAMVWNLDTEEWPEIACRAAGRNLTQAEWDQFGPEGEPYRATCPQWP